MAVQQLKLLLLSIIGIIRRMCCFGRRRKHSFSADTLEIVQIVSANPNKRNNFVEKDWNSWDDSPQTVEEHIEEYRKRIAKPVSERQPEVELDKDLLSELTPNIKPQQKFYLEDNTNDNNNDFSRLEAITDVVIVNAELLDWEETDTGDWEELDSKKTKELIREKRRELRNQRQRNAKTGIDNRSEPPSMGLTKMT